MKSKSGEFFGTYGAQVVSNADPLHIGRVKIRVPTLHGVQGESGIIQDADLPWAYPSGMPAGGTSESGTVSWIPVDGDQVWVRFLDGELDKPIWEWGNQNIRQHTSAQQYSGNDPARRAILTRYGNSVEITPDNVTVTTKNGYQVLLGDVGSETGGTAALQTPAGQRLEFNDLTKTCILQGLDAAVISAAKVLLNAPTSALLKATRFTLMAGESIITVQGKTLAITTSTGATILIDDQGNMSLNSAQGDAVSISNGKIQAGTADGTGIVVESGKVSINGQQTVLNTSAISIGTQAGSPVFLLTADAIAYFLGHTHTNGNNGSPTGPPIPLNPLFPQSAGSTRLQAS